MPCIDSLVIVEVNDDLVNIKADVTAFNQHRQLITDRIIACLKEDPCLHPLAAASRFRAELSLGFDIGCAFVSYLMICVTAFSIEFKHPIPKAWVADNWISQTLATDLR